MMPFLHESKNFIFPAFTIHPIEALAGRIIAPDPPDDMDFLCRRKDTSDFNFNGKIFKSVILFREMSLGIFHTSEYL